MSKLIKLLLNRNKKGDKQVKEYEKVAKQLNEIEAMTQQLLQQNAKALNL